jgi:hypothetical protein
MQEDNENVAARLILFTGRIAEIDDTMNALARRRADLVRRRAELESELVERNTNERNQDRD